MKTLVKLSLLLIVLAVFIAGCDKNENLTAPKGMGLTRTDEVMPYTTRTETQYPIWAGQDIPAGHVSIFNDQDYIYLTYHINADWMMTESHVHVAATLDGIPHTKKGIPIPGQFDYSEEHMPPVNEYTYYIPLDDYDFVCEQTVIIAAHCALVSADYPEEGYESETGWGGDTSGPGPRWWYYMQYTITCDTPPGGDDFQFETAMMRMYDNPYDFTYNWGTHPWFSYVRTTPAATPQTYYFYAGQHYKCGEVQIWKEGDFLKVQFTMMNNWQIMSSALDVGLTGYSGPPAFGLFDHSATHDPLVTSSYTYSVPWNMDWNDMELCVALHGDVRLPLP